MSILATCDEGCGKRFTIKEMPVTKLGEGIEKTSFACEHCQHEYVAFYTDEEVRKLQEEMRNVTLRIGRKNGKSGLVLDSLNRMSKQIKEKMDALRKRVEGV